MATIDCCNSTTHTHNGNKEDDLDKSRANLPSSHSILSELRKEWAAFGQEHIFQWQDELSPQQLSRFIDDLRRINPKEVHRIYTETVAKRESSSKTKTRELLPLPVTKFSDTTEADRIRWEKIGFDLISQGKVGVLLLAGGQATRLGAVFPKGMYDVGLPSQRSLYQIQAEKCVRLKKLVTQHTGVAHPSIPWYIMTSPATFVETQQYFIKHNYFGLPPQDVRIFNQDMLPAVTPEGRIILESKSKIALAPNGNGGLYKALKTSGALEDMKKRGVEYISQYCVDNILIQVADPVFVGFQHESGADCAAKVVGKAYPEEPVGVVSIIDGKPGVVEYSEIDPETRQLRDPVTGQLVFNYAHICINSFSRNFLEEIAYKYMDEIPFHVAFKKIPYVNQNGEQITPSKENGWKLEMFIFDVFQFSKKMVALEVHRDEEFSPLKNAPGSLKDSPETCLQDYCKLHTKYIQNAGGIVLPSSDSHTHQLVEISPLVSYKGEDLEPLVKGKTFSSPVEIK
eukprot:TRINITY_DN2036_c0_g1_i1.p1 TRINITY_DN2036_c0_g1~~TRINITY_DN2036_c0_g1_i1.p1  ORF type:complete len:512 (-),score=102.25 TRINITY_DN2036_c0_g1_i1:40-1575(-)